MSRSPEASRARAESSVEFETDERYSDPDLPPVLSQRRPAVRAHGASEEPARDESHDTIPAPMWFIDQ